MAPEVRLTTLWLASLWPLLVRSLTPRALLHTSPCAYPIYVERRECGGVQESQILDGLFCDPDSTISMSEMHLIDESVQRAYRSNHQKCICPESRQDQCWYKFAFAFLRELKPVDGALTDAHTSDHCPVNNSFVLTPPSRPLTPESVSKYGGNFARVLRERWNVGECGEEILVLVVQRRPELLVRAGQEARPVIFVSYGSLVGEKLASLESNTFALPLDPLRRIVEDENLHLQEGFPINRVIISLIGRIVGALTRAETSPRTRQHKDHIPRWAWIVFATCGVSCCIMGVGLCLIRSTSRRASQRGKPNVDSQRKTWKAGFGGGLWYEL